MQIDPETRQWLGVILIGTVIAAMIFTGLIPASLYQPYIAPILGAFAYHIIRALNPPRRVVQ